MVGRVPSPGIPPIAGEVARAPDEWSHGDPAVG